jgi:hypothetical protein
MRWSAAARVSESGVSQDTPYDVHVHVLFAEQGARGVARVSPLPSELA